MTNLVAAFKLIDKLDDQLLQGLSAAIEAGYFKGPLAPIEPIAKEVKLALDFLQRIEAVLKLIPGFGG